MIIGSPILGFTLGNFFARYWFLSPFSNTGEGKPRQMSRDWVKSLLAAGISEHTCSPTSKVLISYCRRWIWLLINRVNLINVMVVSQIHWNVLHYIARRKIQSWGSKILPKTEWKGRRNLDVVAVTVNICSTLSVFFQMLYWMNDFSHNRRVFLDLSPVSHFSCQICAKECRATLEM